MGSLICLVFYRLGGPPSPWHFAETAALDEAASLDSGSLNQTDRMGMQDQLSTYWKGPWTGVAPF